MPRDLPEFDPYSELGVSRDAGSDEIEAAYRSLVRQHHPDVAMDPGAGLTRTKRLNAARTLLSHPGLRAAYDRDSSSPRPHASQSPDTEDQATAGIARALSAGMHPRRAFRPDPSQVDLNALATRSMVATIVADSTLGVATGLPGLLAAAVLLDIALVVLALRLNGPATDTPSWSGVGIAAAVGSVTGSVVAIAVVWIIDRIAQGLLADVARMIATHAVAWGLVLGIPLAAVLGALLAETRWAVVRSIGHLLLSSALIVGAVSVAYAFVTAEVLVRP